MIAAKLRLTAIVACFLLISVLGQAVFHWYPKITEYNLLQAEIDTLQKSVANLRMKQEKSLPAQWEIKQEQASKELAMLKQIFAHMKEEMSVSRLNYQQGTLQLWAECQDNTVITRLIGRLSAEGWIEPVLNSYIYSPEKITFSITVKLQKL